eukprot:scaffold69368_cov63-Phaeocystis_antarctica.AAC.1
MPLPLAQLRGVTPSEGWPDEGSGHNVLRGLGGRVVVNIPGRESRSHAGATRGAPRGVPRATAAAVHRRGGSGMKGAGRVVQGG